MAKKKDVKETSAKEKLVTFYDVNENPIKVSEAQEADYLKMGYRKELPKTRMATEDEHAAAKERLVARRPSEL